MLGLLNANEKLDAILWLLGGDDEEEAEEPPDA